MFWSEPVPFFLNEIRSGSGVQYVWSNPDLDPVFKIQLDLDQVLTSRFKKEVKDEIK